MWSSPRAMGACCYAIAVALFALRSGVCASSMILGNSCWPMAGTKIAAAAVAMPRTLPRLSEIQRLLCRKQFLVAAVECPHSPGPNCRLVQWQRHLSQNISHLTQSTKQALFGVFGYGLLPPRVINKGNLLSLHPATWHILECFCSCSFTIRSNQVRDTKTSYCRPSVEL